MVIAMSACDILYFPSWRKTTHRKKGNHLVRLHFIDMHEGPGALKLTARRQIHFALNSA
jgi:hypothetical protein